MSRFGEYDGDESFPNQGEFWWANAKRALNGRKGRKALAELREALLALPEKRLIQGALSTVGARDVAAAMPEQVPSFDGTRLVPNYEREELLHFVERQGEGVCAIGAYVWWKKVKEGLDPEAAFAELPRLLPGEGDGDADFETASLAQKELGLTFTLAWTLAEHNDESHYGVTPEERYERFLAWINEQFAEEPSGGVS